MPTKTSLPARSQAAIAAQLSAQFRYATFDQQAYLRDRALHRSIDQAPQVTCAMFRQRAKSRGWTTPWLIEQVRGDVDRPAEPVKRVLGLAPAETLVPYGCLIALYERATAVPLAGPGERRCACGCLRRVKGRQRWGSSACKKRMQRAS
jgi:hypothetical protein